ncbi:MAG: 1,4-dihydroxy-6-naphthoate synthase [Leptospirales bacterium]|nr:1,4-dihydroxy-6-naphthoate synthase [Leptospirales bacterium]
MSVEIAISPCPNDTFIFFDLARRGLSSDRVDLQFADVEELNRRAIGEAPHILSKMSFFASFQASAQYDRLAPGGAMGFGCGPLLVAANEQLAREAQQDASRLFSALAPGRWTTANLLTHLYLMERGASLDSLQIQEMRYDRIIPALQSAQAEYGVIIHEERFTYQQRGLVAVVDLGQWWEASAQSPIPLGCIGLRKDAPEWLRLEIEQSIRQSIEQARRQPPELMPFIRQHSQELSDRVIRAHIDLYVNDFSLEPGAAGFKAIDELQRRAAPLLSRLQSASV